MEQKYLYTSKKSDKMKNQIDKLLNKDKDLQNNCESETKNIFY